MSIKPCCVSGSIHAGTPTGSVTTVHSLPTYVSQPEGTKKGTIVWLVDIFGFELVNTRLVADEWAKQGWKVLVPDILNGDPVDHGMLNSITPNLRVQEEQTVLGKAANAAKNAATLGPWFITHRADVTKPIVRSYLEAVRAEVGKEEKVVAIGTCFGGAHVIYAGGKDSLVDAVVAYHPANLSLPTDLEALTVPTLILIGDKDAFMSTTEIDQARAIFDQRKDVAVEIKVYPNAVHGFSVRGDQTVPEEKKHKENGFQDACEFLRRVLKV